MLCSMLSADKWIDNQGAVVIIPWRFYIALVKLRWSALLVCWSLLHGWRTWDTNSLQMVSSWSQNIDIREKASNVASHGLLCRYGIVISFTCKVASRVKSDGLKAMLWCRVVLWEIVRLDCGLVLWACGWFVGLVDNLLYCGLWIMWCGCR